MSKSRKRKRAAAQLSTPLPHLVWRQEEIKRLSRKRYFFPLYKQLIISDQTKQLFTAKCVADAWRILRQRAEDANGLHNPVQEFEDHVDEHGVRLYFSEQTDTIIITAVTHTGQQV